MNKAILLVLAVVATGVVVGASSVTFALAANSNHDLFKNWKSLIDPIVALQERVSELEAQVEFLREEVAELEQKIDGTNSYDDTIFIDTDDFEYVAGEDVGIEGVIGENILDAGNELFIAVIEPAGGSEEDEVEVSSDGDFEFVYELASSAVDGLYTIRVEYEGVEVYSYFIVGGNDNLAFLDVEDDVFSAGQNVEMVGEVLDPVTGEDEVTIFVLDPSGDELIQEEVDLDAEDVFEHEFDLPNISPLGRYAIIVEYDGDIAGHALFEVHG
jgi:hypothetical protein